MNILGLTFAGTATKHRQEDLDAAMAALSLANVKVGQVTQNAQERYAHFRAPDGHLYELVERKDERK